jgi:hypothetical protein
MQTPHDRVLLELAIGQMVKRFSHFMESEKPLWVTRIRFIPSHSIPVRHTLTSSPTHAQQQEQRSRTSATDSKRHDPTHPLKHIPFLIVFFCTLFVLNPWHSRLSVKRMYSYKVVQIWPGQTVTCLHTISPGHIWTTLYLSQLKVKVRDSLTTNFIPPCRRTEASSFCVCLKG